MPEPDPHRDVPAPPSTYLVIPYFPGDRGDPKTDRPVPAPAVSYACPSIHVTGTPAPGVFRPAEPFRVAVEVANFGVGTSAAAVSVIVWWSTATSGFTDLRWFGQAVVAVPSHGGRATTVPMTNSIPADAGPHVCLLARATAVNTPLPAGAGPDPVHDPHWAQLNLVTAPVPPGQAPFPFDFAWSAGNPGARTARYVVSARPTGAVVLRTLARTLDARPVVADDLRLVVDGEEGPRVLELEAGESRELRLAGILGTPLERGTFTAIDIVQEDVTGDGDGDGRIVGAVGLILRADTGDGRAAPS
ncbi:hypothetical protein ACFRCG_10500 [Embleya sp. NPDC056575]|uniref:hypothetical protein n=1 Tax=unclassified Embleya TaxID=2699296 RepID=UPI003688CF42